MLTTKPVHINTNPVESSAWFFKIEKQKKRKKEPGV